MTNQVVYCRVTPQELIELNSRAEAQSRSRNNYVTVKLAEALDEEFAPRREISTVAASESVALFLRLPPRLKTGLVARANELGLSVSKYVRSVLFQ